MHARCANKSASGPIFKWRIYDSHTHTRRRVFEEENLISRCVGVQLPGRSTRIETRDPRIRHTDWPSR